MKNYKKVSIITILLILIIIIGLILLRPQKEDYSTIKQVNSFSAENLVIEKTYRWCTIEFDLVRQNLKDENLEYYDAYFLDESNNLIYVEPLENFADFVDENPGVHISYDLNYDVSNTKYIKIVFKGTKYKYNKDLRDKLKELPLNDDLEEDFDA